VPLTLTIGFSYGGQESVNVVCENGVRDRQSMIRKKPVLGLDQRMETGFPK
jgi:hypothetical protein